ncbi:hypothetical protein B0T10DRAFT_589332 [Thelonectria olida]|uniref:RRM domain-containing protein n=1 Tax=Thelonectria olida TaxID=1576542 RepID=A0A9P8VRT2_9HYPO|nr:hypothetical protein B0T10DRAFT_589332 [Thelonectria olida]
MASQTLNIDRYVVIHVATTCDEHGIYVTKDSAEVIELSWVLLDANSLEDITHESILVKPLSTPITPLCTSSTTLTWEHVRNAGTFRDAIARFDRFATEYLTSKNLDFVFVTLDAWDLRVQLPREARDKAIALSSYLQHSRTFDLRTEYQRWHAPIKHNPAFHLQALAPALPRRAMEVAITLARVLRGLINKSQPPQEHPDVLTRPMDARADVRAFLSERSKVLHMSGLPHDTTQSELESWFTQFGGRPIAFWTLRTPEQHKPTGTGFAVFSSHEEAAECLCMNGRALNEKAIEVSPSSRCVLDRARGILNPFPPSKNRPRPGDWTCPSSVGAGLVKEIGGNTYGYGGYGPPAMMSPLPHGGHHGPMGHGGRMVGSGVVHFCAGDWKCGNEVCGFHNFAKNVCCLRCCASRAGAAVVADSRYPSSMDNFYQYSMSQGSMAGTPGSGDYNQHFGTFGWGLGSHSAGPFDSRAAETAFQSTSNCPASGGPSKNFYNSNANNRNENDPFTLLSSGIRGLLCRGSSI